MNDSDLCAAAYRVFAFGFPAYEVARTRHGDVMGLGGMAPLPPQGIRHERKLAGAGDRWITTPNNDTLYSRAWLDLSRGPVTVRVAQQPAGRYWSVDFMDAFARNFALIGQRLHGEGPAAITLIGPSDPAAEVPGRVVRAPSNDVWLLARWIVEGPQDLPRAQAMQDGLSIDAPPPGVSGQVDVTSAMDPENFLAVLAEQIRRNPLVGDDRRYLGWLADAGVDPARDSPWTHLPMPVREVWLREIGPFHRRVSQAALAQRRQVGGWWVSPESTGDILSGCEWRAGVALFGLGGLDPSEAIYAARLADGAGQPLHGEHRYRLVIPPSGIPAKSFWSLSMYQVMPDGRRYFVDNPVSRYSIGNRTADLLPEADGSVVIHLQREAPLDGRGLSNWLPTPPGPFMVTLRAYWPDDALRQGSAPMPGVDRL